MHEPSRLGRDDQKPSQGAVETAASFDQPSQSIMLAEQSAHAIASPVAAPGGDAGPTQPLSPSSSSSVQVSPGETSTFKAHDAAEMVARSCCGRRPETIPIGARSNPFLALTNEAIVPTKARRRLPLRQLRPRLSRRPGRQIQSSRLVPALYQAKSDPRRLRRLWPVWRRHKRPYPCPSYALANTGCGGIILVAIDSNGSNLDSVVMLFPKRLHQFWPLWRRRRCPKPCRQLRHRQRRMRRHHPHLPSDRSSQNFAQIVRLCSKRRHQSWPVWRRHKRPYPGPQLRPRRHRMRRHQPRLPSNPTVRIRAQVVMLFSKLPASVLAALATRRHPHPCRQLRHRQRGMRRHHPHLPPNRSGQNLSSNSEAVYEAPASVAADLATPQASISLPTDTPSPTPDAAASSSFAIESHGSNPG